MSKSKRKGKSKDKGKRRKPAASSEARPEAKDRPEAEPERKPKRKKAEGAVPGRVLPLEIGQDGVTVQTPRYRYALAHGVVGERLSVRPLSLRGRAPLRGRYPPARVERVLERAETRVEAPCAVLERCGACSLQQQAYAAQVADKSDALRRALARFGVDGERVADVVGLSQPFGYRTKLLMPCENSTDGLRFGLYRRGTLRLTPAEGCPVQHPLTLATLALLRPVLEAAGVRATTMPRGDSKANRARGRDGESGGGWLHAVALRADPSSARVEVILCANSPRVPGAERTVQQLAALPGVASLHLSIQPERSSYPLVPPFRHLAGDKRMAFHIGGERFELSPGTFVQTNAEAADALVTLVRDVLGRRDGGDGREGGDGGDGREDLGSFVDLYGGAGMFARTLAGRWSRAVVVEENPSAVDDLERYLAMASAAPTGLSVRRARVEQHADRLLREAAPDVVLLDPPRRGTKPGVIEAITRAAPATVVYVACGFEGLLADLAKLLESGYDVTRAGAVDMFPHTAHLEVVVRLDRRAEADSSGN